MTRPCSECEKQRKPRDLAPLRRNVDGVTPSEICRKCFDQMVEGGSVSLAGGPTYLRGEWTFWMRQNGMDVEPAVAP